MNGAHLHLLLNHVPVIGSVFGAALLAWMLVRGRADGRRVALAALVIVALASLPAYFTGEPAEDTIEHQPGVEERRIESHEGAAKLALAGALVTGVVALAGLVIFRRREPAPGFLGVVLLLGVLSVAMFARTANLGGEIRHPEIRAGAQAPAAAEASEASETGDRD
jgi:hypothetical protein